MKKLTYVFAIVLLIVSCSKDDDATTNDVTNPDSNLFVKKIVRIYTDGDKEELNYTYDGNKLIKMNISDSDNFDVEVSFIYDSDGLLTEINKISTEINSSTALNYDQAGELEYYTISQTDKVDNSNSANRYFIDINTNGNIEVENHKVEDDGSTTFYDDYRIEFDNDNITFRDYGGLSNDILEYDNKNGLFKNIHARNILKIMDDRIFDNEVDLNVSANNMTKLTDNTPSGGGEVFTVIDTYEYTYNNSGYPETLTAKWFGELDYTEEYFYE